MKLHELLKQLIIDHQSKFIDGFIRFSCEDLNACKDKLLQTDEFRNTKKIYIVNTPVFLDEHSIPINTHTYTLNNDILFSETVVLYSISIQQRLSPDALYKIMSCTGSWYKTPTIYDPNTFGAKNLIFYSFTDPIDMEEYVIDKILEDLKEKLMQKKPIPTSSVFSHIIMIRCTQESISNLGTNIMYIDLGD